MNTHRATTLMLSLLAITFSTAIASAQMGSGGGPNPMGGDNPINAVEPARRASWLADVNAIRQEHTERNAEMRKLNELVAKGQKLPALDENYEKELRVARRSLLASLEYVKTLNLEQLREIERVAAPGNSIKHVSNAVSGQADLTGDINKKLRVIEDILDLKVPVVKRDQTIQRAQALAAGDQLGAFRKILTHAWAKDLRVAQFSAHKIGRQILSAVKHFSPTLGIVPVGKGAIGVAALGAATLAGAAPASEALSVRSQAPAAPAQSTNLEDFASKDWAAQAPATAVRQTGR